MYIDPNVAMSRNEDIPVETRLYLLATRIMLLEKCVYNLTDVNVTHVRDIEDLIKVLNELEP